MQQIPEVLQKRVRILEMGTSAITGVYARGLFFEKRLDSTRASRKAGESLCRASNPGKADVKNCGILCFVQDVPMPGRSGLTW